MSGIEAAAYTQGEQFQLEKRTLFRAAWLPLCAAASVATPGAWASQSIGGWPVLALRGRDGVLRGFQNQCRHQRMPLVEKPEGSCEGALRCRFHGWTYGDDGALQVAPPLYAPTSDDTSLLALAMAEVAGVVFLRFAEGAAPPEAAPAGALAATTEVGANWKLVVEAALLQGWRLRFPLLLEDGAGRTRLVIPRSFLRTRVLELGSATLTPEVPALEALHAGLNVAGVPAGDAAVQAFRAQAAAACVE